MKIYYIFLFYLIFLSKNQEQKKDELNNTNLELNETKKQSNETKEIFDINPEDEKLIDQLIEFEESKNNLLNNNNTQNLTSEELRQKQKEESEKIFQENITYFLNEMGLGNNTSITKEQFISLFKKLFNSGERNKENENENLNKSEKEQSFQEAYAEIFMETILSKIIDDVPNEVLVKDIAKYFVPEKIVEALQEMIGNASNIFNNESDKVIMIIKMEKKKKKLIYNLMYNFF